MDNKKDLNSHCRETTSKTNFSKLSENLFSTNKRPFLDNALQSALICFIQSVKLWFSNLHFDLYKKN